MKISEPRNLRPYNQDQMELFPPSVRSLIEDDHLCMVVNDVVKAMDLSCLYQKVSHEGNPAYHPGMMLKFGGHAMAAGLTIEETWLARFQTAFDAEVQRIASPEILKKTILTDGELAAADMSLETWQMLEEAGPWGQGFPEPLFYGRFRVINQRVLKDRHYKLMLEPLTGEAMYFDGIAFNQLEGDESPAAIELPDELGIIYKLALNEYNGQRNLQLMIDAIIT